MKFCCASNAAIKNVKITRKKINFFPKYFSKNRNFSKMYRLKKKDRCLGLIVKLLVNYLQHHLESMINYKNYVNFKF